MQEDFKTIPGFDLYKAGDNGTILSFQKNQKKELSAGIDRYGYKYVVLYRDGKKFKFKVHRLVAACFLGLDLFEVKYDAHGTCVCHKNDKRDDNRACNLFLGSNYDNMQDRNKKGRTFKKL